VTLTDGDVPAVGVDDAPDDVQSEAGPVLVRRVAHVEYRLAVVGRYPGTVVLDGEPAVGPADGDGHVGASGFDAVLLSVRGRARGTVFHGVV